MTTTIGATAPGIVPGEYDHVARRSANVDALRRAHATPISKADAVAMLRRLAREHLSAADALTMVIRWGTTRGRGGLLYPRKRVPRLNFDGTPRLHWRTGKPRYRMVRSTPAGEGVPFVSLPSVLMPAYGVVAVPGAWIMRRNGKGQRWRKGTMCLRVGLVLHEFAHVMCPRDRHNDAFVARLDALIAAWGAENAPAIAAGAER